MPDARPETTFGHSGNTCSCLNILSVIADTLGLVCPVCLMGRLPGGVL
jgi:hypothetical protein